MNRGCLVILGAASVGAFAAAGAAMVVGIAMWVWYPTEDSRSVPVTTSAAPVEVLIDEDVAVIPADVVEVVEVEVKAIDEPVTEPEPAPSRSASSSSSSSASARPRPRPAPEPEREPAEEVNVDELSIEELEAQVVDDLDAILEEMDAELEAELDEEEPKKKKKRRR
jgi:hypothetical protein